MTIRHQCHAILCTNACPPERLMCSKHWSKVPFRLKQGVYAHYREGQTVDMRPSRAWVEAAKSAIRSVAEIEAVNRELIARDMERWDAFARTVTGGDAA